jgi:hypothetical protein
MRRKWLGLAEGWRMIDEVAGISFDMRQRRPPTNDEEGQFGDGKE